MTPILDGSDDGNFYEEPSHYYTEQNDMYKVRLPYPTEWRMLDSLNEIEVRQVTADTYELRSPTRKVTVNSEAFDLYRTNSDAFEQWLIDSQTAVYTRYDYGL